MKILGVDPGSRVTGYGIIEKSFKGLAVVGYGEIKPPKNASLTTALASVYEALSRLIVEMKPDAMAVEDIFYGKNVQSLIKLGHIRGVTLLAGAQQGITVYEYTPLEIKKAVVGYGRAEKSQVQAMVKAILQLRETPTADAADALAVAICHAHCSGPSVSP
jgi:crossover junction endodeoxyribonuclease RuvC